jgi:phosphinothricin acetyltransferase
MHDASDADLPFILDTLNLEIEESAYVYAENPVTLDERRSWLARHREADLPVIVATTADLVPLGWGALSTYRSSSGYRFTLEASVYVSRQAQRRGIGRSLLEELEHRARSQGAHAIVASIDSANAPSIVLFEKFGYAEAGRLDEVGWKFGAWRTQLLYLKRLT